MASREQKQWDRQSLALRIRQAALDKDFNDGYVAPEVLMERQDEINRAAEELGARPEE